MAAHYTLSRRDRNPAGTKASALDTPALVIDLDAMERNLCRMARYASQHKLLLRPHFKMHRCTDIAKLLLAEGGAVGFCVQKLGEAETLVGAGINNIYVSNEIVDPRKLARFAELAKAVFAMKAGPAPTSDVAICCDSVEGVERLAKALRHAGAAGVRVMVEIDVGQNRCGCLPGDGVAVDIAKAVVAHSDVMTFGGIQAYHGAAQHHRAPEQRRETISKVVDLAKQTKAAIEAAGIPVPLVTGAGSGTFTLEATSGLYGELQPGSYLVYDRDYADNVADESQPHFEHALFVATRVMSTGSKLNMAVVDAGHKSHAVDSGQPTVYGRSDLSFRNGGDEHGILEHRHTIDGAEAPLPVPLLNELVYLVPGHCDPTFNLHDTAVGLRGGLDHGVVEKTFVIDARGCCY
jgi:D-serine deaminase-like pyridoxal phosphate-dependent protein